MRVGRRNRRWASDPSDIEAGRRGLRAREPPGGGLCASQKHPAGPRLRCRGRGLASALTLERPLAAGAHPRAGRFAGSRPPFQTVLRHRPGCNGAQGQAFGVRPRAGQAGGENTGNGNEFAPDVMLVFILPVMGIF